jgi:hypothetical protein
MAPRCKSQRARPRKTSFRPFFLPDKISIHLKDGLILLIKRFEISVPENPPILQEIKELEIGKVNIL